MNVKKHLSILTAFVLSASATLAGAGGLPVTPDISSSGEFKIASSLGYAPFEFVDADGSPAGLNIELAQAMAKLLGAKLQIENVPFANQIPGLAAGRFKVGWATFSVTEERLKQVDFVSFMQAGTVAVTRPENAARFADRAALCGASIAVPTGTAADFAADKLSADCEANGRPVLQKAIYPEQKDVIQAVLSNRAEAYLDDSTSAGYYQTTTGGKLVVAGDAFYPTPLGVAVAKGDTATAAMMKAGFEALIADGTYGATLSKYNMATSGQSQIVIYTSPDQLSN